MIGELPNRRTLEEGYKALILDRARAATCKESALRFYRQDFRKAVLNYYDAKDPDSGDVFCHLTGWKGNTEVKVSHLVPKSIGQDRLQYLFGGQVEAATDVRNALLLHRKLKARLDKGDIAIVPMIGEENKWQCVVTRPDKMEDPLFKLGEVRLKEFHKKDLQFCSFNRPAKRYLFFRFIVTYLQQEADGNVAWTADIAKDVESWATPGGYLRRSTLVTLAKAFGGDDLATKLLELSKTTTFPDDEGLSSETDSELRLERANLSMIQLIQSPPDDDDEGDDCEEGDDSEGGGDCEGGDD
ncbi:hypothetical protein FQN54_006533 [Arachnomyces sp. PD_36]|nr:hypothetical protein FQN54_006533 [Arachnomyces sp. PD_36]